MLAEQLREQVKGAQVSFTVLARLRQELREAHARWEEKR